MVHTSTKKEVIRYSWDNQVVGGVKFHDSIVELTYLGETYFLPLSHPLTDAEFYTEQHPDNWKYSTVGRWLVTGEEI